MNQQCDFVEWVVYLKLFDQFFIQFFLRKISSNAELNFDLKSENKLSLKSDSADFNLLCLPTDNFPSFADEFEGQEGKPHERS